MNEYEAERLLTRYRDQKVRDVARHVPGGMQAMYAIWPGFRFADWKDAQVIDFLRESEEPYWAGRFNPGETRRSRLPRKEWSRETRLWIDERIVDIIRRSYRLWEERKKFFPPEIAPPREPNLTVTVLMDYLNEERTPMEWRIASRKQQRSFLEVALNGLMETGVLNRSLSGGERGREAYAYDPVTW